MADNDRSDSEDAGDNDRPPQNPFEALFGPGGFGGQGFGGQGFGGQGFGGQGQFDFEAMARHMQQMFSQMGSQLGLFGAADADAEQWRTVRDLARRVVNAKGADPTPTHASRRQLGDAARIVEGWLDRHVDLPPTSGTVQAWSRAEWVENSMPTWRRLIDPVANALADAMADLATGEPPTAGEENPMAGLEEFLRPMLRHTGSAVFTAQAADAIGALAASCVSGTEATLPLGGDHAHTIAVLPTNLAEFADGLAQDDHDIWLVLTLREAARQRLFAAHPWVGERLMALVERYAHGITIDTSGLEEAMNSLQSASDPAEMQRLSEQMQGRLFAPARTPEQEQVLAEIETLLALVDGWIEDVTADITGQWMPTAAPIVESLRRRRAASGPTEATFKALVGLELRPRRVRDAENLWAALRQDGGSERREAPWQHPDMVPTTADLDDPIGFVTGDRAEQSGAEDDFDAELRRLLDGDAQ